MEKWTESKLSQHTEIFSGFAFKSFDMTGFDSGYPIIKIAQIQNKEVLKNVEEYFPSEKFTHKLNRYKLRKTDTLIAMTGAGSVGKVGKMKSIDRDYLVNQRVALIRSKAKDIDDEFLFYFLSQDFIERGLYDIGLGAGQPNISPADIGKIDLLIPPLHEQQRIASILSAYDDLIEVNNKRITLLEQMTEQIYKEWFIRMRFPDYENTLFEKGLPHKWEIKKVKDFGKVITGKTPSTFNSGYYGGEYFFIKTPDMHGNTFTLQTEETLTEDGFNSQKSQALPPNSICVSCIGTGGVVTITSSVCMTNQQINSLVLKNQIELEFLFFALKGLKSTIEMFGSTGATMTNLSKGKFENLKLIKPNNDLIEQFSFLTKPMFICIRDLSLQQLVLKKTRDLLLPRLISGKLQVNNIKEPPLSEVV